MKKIILVILLSTCLVHGQDKKSYFSGSLINDTQLVLNSISDSNNSLNIDISRSTKSPFLSGLMSFAVPGAGQIYTENYLKAGIFLAVEVGAVILAVSYDKKGDDQTELFENYANNNWSAERYARWTIANLNQLNGSLDPINYNLFDNNGKVNWNELNKLESDIGGYYSHKLAPFGDQQYYEMIGKYPQFNVGWIEFGDDVNKPFDYETPVVAQFKSYSKERGKANDYYNVAKWAVIAVVSNHFISALDAAWSASKYNKKLKLNISIEEKTIGYYQEYYPKLNLLYNF